MSCYLPSDPALYDLLTGQQNIDFALAIRGAKNRSRVKELADRLEIDLKRRLKTLSRGNKQKVATYVKAEFSEAAPDLAAMAGVRDLHVEGRKASFTFHGGIDPLMAML